MTREELGRMAWYAWCETMIARGSYAAHQDWETISQDAQAGLEAEGVTIWNAALEKAAKHIEDQVNSSSSSIASSLRELDAKEIRNLKVREQ